jgi:hypothetical protein
MEFQVMHALDLAGHHNTRTETLMKRLLFPVLIALLMAGSSAATASAQTCRAADDSSFDMIEMIKTYALASDSIGKATADSLGIPAVASASAIQLITKEATCRSANTAYQAVATGARQTLSGRVYVVQVGAAYVVWDPQYRYSTSADLDVYVAFTSKWVKKSIF